MAVHTPNASDGEWWNLEQLQNFGSKVAWVSSDSDFQIWWKLRYLAEAFVTCEIYNTHKWLRQTFARQVDNSMKFVNQQLRNCNVDVGASGSEPMFLFCSDDGNNLQEHVCKTSGLLHFLFHYGESCRDEKIFQSILDRMKTIGGSIMEFSLHLQQQFVFAKLQSFSGTNVSGGLLISGFLQALQNRFVSVLPTVRQIWCNLKEQGCIQTDFPLTVGNPVGFADLLMFTFCSLRLRTKQNKTKAKSLVQLIGLLRFDFIDVISKCLNSYIEYKVQNDSRFAVARNLPAIRRKSRSDRPVRVEVDPETIWALMESAKFSSVSLRQALLLKKDDSMSSPELAGASEAKAEYWSRKITGLYINRVQNVFKMVTQLSLVADASTHSGKEILVSCAYAPSEKLGCHAVIQHLNTGSLKPSEVDVSLLATIAKNRKLQRMSAFRQLQAIDKQLALLSNNRLGLDGFSMKDVMLTLQEEQKEGMAEEEKKKKQKKHKQMEGRFQSRASVVEGHGVNNPPESENSGGHIVVDPTRQFIFQLSKKYASPSGIVDVNEIRTWDTDLEGNSFEVVRNEMSNISVPILLQEKYWWRSVPLLVLSLDQGPIGAAGMAFALQGHRIHVKFDKIHRCIRDYKLALGRAMGGVFLKTQLHSSYIFGLNYKPFNTGLFHEQKKTMLEAFLESHNISSDLWQEFRERIAFDFGQTNVINDRLLFEAVTELESFKNKGTLIKPSRWFSWNQCCEEFLPEFHTLKMLAKYEFKDNVRPLDEAEEPPEGMTSIVLGQKTQPESKQRAREDENILKTMERMKKNWIHVKN